MDRHRDETGQVTLFVATLGVLLAGGILVFVASLGGVVNDRARARTAADAAALAGAASGQAAAADIASRNGGVVEAYTADGDRVTVTVRVGRARATSVAERSWQVRRGSHRPLGWSLGSPVGSPGWVSRSEPVIPYTRHDVFHRFRGEP